MSVSTYITFLKDRDYHEQMLEAARALAHVKVKELPIELAEYFGTNDPDEALNDTDELLDVASCSLDYPGRLPYVREANNDHENAVEIDIDKLPPNVKHIKVSRS
jgi:hypothetical protein